MMTAASHPDAAVQPRIAPLGPGDLPRLCALHRRLHDAAAEPGLFVEETPDFFLRHLGDDGQVLGVLDADGGLVGYGVLGLPRAADPLNFGADIDLAPELRGRVAHLDGSGVDPAWRGLGLHRRLLAERIALALRRGRRIMLSTVAPRNHWSLANLVAQGLQVVALISKYDSQRFVLRADLTDTGEPAQTGDASEGPLIPLDELAAHREALAAGWRGTELVATGRDGPAIAYRRPRGTLTP